NRRAAFYVYIGAIKPPEGGLMAKAKTAKNKNEHGSKNPIGWVEVPVNNLGRAKTFYGKTFGFTFPKADLDMYDYKMAFLQPDGDMKSYGSGGALMMGESYKPSYDGA